MFNIPRVLIGVENLYHKRTRCLLKKHFNPSAGPTTAVDKRPHVVKEEAFTPAAKFEGVPTILERKLSRQEKRANRRKATKELLKEPTE